MKTIKQILLFFFGGAPVGATIASFIAPYFVKMWHVPLGEPSALCNCHELADNMVSTYMKMQAGGLVLGGIGGIALLIILRRKGKLRG